MKTLCNALLVVCVLQSWIFDPAAAVPLKGKPRAGPKAGKDPAGDGLSLSTTPPVDAGLEVSTEVPDPSLTSAPAETNITYAFQIKMFWEEGMRWQERGVSRQYCVRCASSCENGMCKKGSCKIGRRIMMYECARGRTEWWVYKEGRISSITRPELCWTRTDKYIEHHPCSLQNKKQVFTPLYEFSKFQIRARQDFGLLDKKKAKCLSSDHHPKSGEGLLMEQCLEAEKNDKGVYDDTSYWVVGIGWYGHTGNRNWNATAGGYYPARDGPRGRPAIDGGQPYLSRPISKEKRIRTGYYTTAYTTIFPMSSESP